MLVAERTRSEEFAQLKKASRLSVKKLSEMLGEKESTVHNWVYGSSQAIPDVVMQKMRSIGLGFNAGPPIIPASQLLIPIPYIGKISASEKASWSDPFETDTFEYVPPEMGDARGRFACKVDGDSMYDLLFPEDIVVFQASNTPKIGFVVLFKSDDQRGTIKTLKHDGRGYILCPENGSYAIEEARGVIVGYLVGIVREQGSRRVTVYDAHGIRP